ncbi:unnamed protein product [Cyclocybe aegerita]|uniref:Copper transport protein n=1 Tax=Cyclocybe aegerita TaxID=1973307 RepID=A0A8S0W8H0_CYCAE|nr:unnamed protein product [Cyclocybe aegerita]
MPSPTSNQRLVATFSLILALFPLLAAAHEGHDDDMDMGTDTAMVMTSGHMVPYLHFTPGADTIWFEGWVPTSAGAVAGASKEILQSRATAPSETRQNEKSYAPIHTQSSSSASSDAHGPAHKPVPPPVPPFSQASALGFAFMLAVMTYNVAYVLAIVIGLGVGETLFGRHISAAGVGH